MPYTHILELGMESYLDLEKWVGPSLRVDVDQIQAQDISKEKYGGIWKSFHFLIKDEMRLRRRPLLAP